MTTYTINSATGVILKDDGSIIPQDDATQAYQDYTEWLAQGNSPEVIDLPLVASTTRRLTKLQFVERFTDEEYAGILTLSKANVMVEAWLRKFELTTPEPDGTSVDLNDPRTAGGVVALCGALEQLGIIEAGQASYRAAAILA